MTVRVYIASSLSRLEALATGSGPPAQPGDRTAYAVTPAARAAHRDADEEELEYLAMTTAALTSAALLEEHEPQRRLVLAVDVAAVEPVGREEPFEVGIPGFRWPDDVAAYHLDSVDAEPAVRAARRAWREQGDHWEDVVSATAAYDLGWYAASEVAELRALLAGHRR
jgi:hypothetical protein